MGAMSQTTFQFLIPHSHPLFSHLPHTSCTTPIRCSQIMGRNKSHNLSSPHPSHSPSLFSSPSYLSHHPMQVFPDHGPQRVGRPVSSTDLLPLHAVRGHLLPQGVEGVGARKHSTITEGMLGGIGMCSVRTSSFYKCKGRGNKGRAVCRHLLPRDVESVGTGWMGQGKVSILVLLLILSN